MLFLNGASSSGKTTLALAVQALVDVPPIHLSSDLLSDGGLPARSDADGHALWWRENRRRFFSGYHHCLAAMARTGLDVIADSLIEAPDWRTELASVLDGLDVYLVGVHCDVDEIDRRERIRGDRAIGEGRTHVEVDQIHGFGPYDHEVDTTNNDPNEIAQSIVTRWSERHVGNRSVLFERPT